MNQLLEAINDFQINNSDLTNPAKLKILKNEFLLEFQLTNSPVVKFGTHQYDKQSVINNFNLLSECGSALSNMKRVKGMMEFLVTGSVIELDCDHLEKIGFESKDTLRQQLNKALELLAIEILKCDQPHNAEINKTHNKVEKLLLIFDDDFFAVAQSNIQQKWESSLSKACNTVARNSHKINVFTYALQTVTRLAEYRRFQLLSMLCSTTEQSNNRYFMLLEKILNGAVYATVGRLHDLDKKTLLYLRSLTNVIATASHLSFHNELEFQHQLTQAISRRNFSNYGPYWLCAGIFLFLWLRYSS